MSIQATVNGQAVQFEVDPETPLLWAIREELGMTGTKFGCGIAASRDHAVCRSARLPENRSPPSRGWQSPKIR